MSVYLINKSPFSVQIFYISIKLQPNGNSIAIGMQKMSTNLLQLPHELSDAKLTPNPEVVGKVKYPPVGT